MREALLLEGIALLRKLEFAVPFLPVTDSEELACGFCNSSSSDSHLPDCELQCFFDRIEALEEEEALMPMSMFDTLPPALENLSDADLLQCMQLVEAEMIARTHQPDPSMLEN